MACHSNDWLSELPDELVVIILTSLPLKESARTSVLSSRWTNLWTHSFCLNFEADAMRHKFAEPDKYVNWVNSVLLLHKAPTLNEFRICFDLDKSNSEAITRWLEFAFARRVQRLELSFLIVGVYFSRHSPMYVFPTEYMRQFDVKSLKALCFRGVSVGGEDIDFFLHNCPFLEELIVQGLREMSKVEVCGSSLALKHLEIFDELPIKISAPKLTSLKVATLSGLLLENVPMLVEFTLIGCDRNIFKHELTRALHCYISQLETLTLRLNITYKESEFCKFPQMPKLKRLVIKLGIWYDQSVVALNCLMRASPHLHELEVKTSVSCFIRVSQKDEENDAMHSPHHHLKVLKFSGYNYGNPNEVEWVRYILVNCAALKKIIIDPYCLRPQDTSRKQITRSYVKQQLEAHVPHHIQLLII